MFGGHLVVGDWPGGSIGRGLRPHLGSRGVNKGPGGPLEAPEAQGAVGPCVEEGPGIDGQRAAELLGVQAGHLRPVPEVPHPLHVQHIRKLRRVPDGAGQRRQGLEGWADHLKGLFFKRLRPFALILGSKQRFFLMLMFNF
jgi:hypothetical protein